MLTFITPTYNECTTIEYTLSELLKVINEQDEVIVVDGDSEDGTQQIVNKFKRVKLLQSQRGRAVQMNMGVRESKNNYIFFLHADTLIDETGLKLLKEEIKDNNVSWGWFKLKFSSSKKIYRILEFLASFRTNLVQEPLGDHGIFVNKQIFEKVGGYPEIPLMEDVELVKKLKKISKGKRINHFVTSSPRRLEKGGILKTVLKMCLIRTLYFFGTSSETLSNHYSTVR